MKETELPNIFPKQKKIAIQIKHPKNIERSYILRDLAVKNGADGAIIVEYIGNELKIFDVEYEEDFSEIKNNFDLKEKDVVVIAYANSYKLAEHGALAVSVELNPVLKHLMSRFN